MKKVILCAAALMFGAFAFGQGDNISGADKATEADDVSLDPSNSNQSETVQYGSFQKVKVYQVGENNSAKAMQTNGFGIGGNQAYIKQTGPDYGSGSEAEANWAEANQNGTANSSYIRQSGALNNARSEQGNSNWASSHNRVKIYQGQGFGQGHPYGGEQSDAYAVQNGHYNQTKIVQKDDNNDAWTNQTGNKNKATVLQESDPNYYPATNQGQESKVVQDGDENQARVIQTGKGARNVANTNQTGFGNKAQQVQNANNAIADSGNEATIDQGQNSFFGSYKAEAFQYQLGKDNIATIEQDGGFFGQNHADQHQEGGNNMAMIDQDHNGFSGDNYAKQKQEGKFNKATLTQSGNGNKSKQIQDGNRNEVVSTQIGSFNKLNTYQYGDYSTALTMQKGIKNAALVEQHDGQSALVDQYGYGNQAHVFQAGPGGPDNAWDSCDFDDPQMYDDIDHFSPLDLEPVCHDCD